jgi:hypothetical protein
MGSLPDGSVRPEWQARQSHPTPSVFFVQRLKTEDGLQPTEQPG